MFNLRKKVLDSCSAVIIFILFLVNFIIAYPGFLTYDSYYQYLQTRDTIPLNNSHPALMSIIWSYLNKIDDGSRLMLLLSLAMIWTSVYFLYNAWKNKLPILSKVLLLLPFTPGILVNSAIIWKDVFFGNATLLALTISIYCSNKNLLFLKKHLCFSIVLILLYFSANVKFQAQFLLPLLLALSIYLIYKLNFIKIILGTIALSLLLFITSHCVNMLYKVENSHFGQIRQFFDIAGISVCLNEDMFPPFVKNEPRYSFEKVIKKYNPAFVNPYVEPTEGIYQSTKDPKKLSELEFALYDSILHHPLCYMNHRLKVFKNLLTNRAARFNTFASFTLDPGLKEQYDYENTVFIKYISKYLDGFTLLSRNFFFVVLNLLFLISLYVMLKSNPSKNKEDIYLCIGFNVICIFFYMVMFFTAMSADNRYLYVARLLTTFIAPLNLFLQMQFFCIDKNYIKSAVKHR